MAQSVTVEAQMELKSPAEKVYEIFRRKSYLLPEIAPHMVKDIKLLAGDWESVGSVRLWTYVAGRVLYFCHLYMPIWIPRPMFYLSSYFSVLWLIVPSLLWFLLFSIKFVANSSSWVEKLKLTCKVNVKLESFSSWKISTLHCCSMSFGLGTSEQSFD